MGRPHGLARPCKQLYAVRDTEKQPAAHLGHLASFGKCLQVAQAIVLGSACPVVCAAVSKRGRLLLRLAGLRMAKSASVSHQALHERQVGI